MNLIFAFLLLAVTTICAEILHKHGLQHRPREHHRTVSRPQITSLSSSEEFTPRTPYLAKFSPRGLDLSGDLRKQFPYVVANDTQYTNVVCSPLAALLPLGTLSFGASGRTFNELARAVGASNEDQISSGFTSLLTSLEGLKGITLKIASRIYLDVNQKLNRRFLSKTKRVFESAVETVDFGNEREAARTINDWVQVRTNGKISDLINPSDVRQSALVLVNAVYFSGRWQNKFRYARPEKFVGPYGKKLLNMMITSGTFDYYEFPILGAQIVSVPFENNKVKMVLVVPRQLSGLAKLTEKLTNAPEKLSKAINMMDEKYIDVELPRFRIETELNLRYIYSKLGLENLMSSSPELNEIVQSPYGLKIGTAKQKTFIEVDENGCTAAAATMISMATTMKMSFPRPIEARVVANRSFMFFILAGNQQLFFGTVSDPQNATH